MNALNTKILKSIFFFSSTFTLFTGALFAPKALAAFAVLESGELLAPQKAELGISSQLLLSDGGGFNLGAVSQFGLNESTNVRAEIGTGDTDFWAGASLKWIPIPDLDSQPAIGARLGLVTGRNNAENFLGFHGALLVSKKIDTTAGPAVPYAALQFLTIDNKTETRTGAQLVAGSEYLNPQWEQVKIVGELAMNVTKSFTSLNVLVAFPFNP